MYVLCIFIHICMYTRVHVFFAQVASLSVCLSLFLSLSLCLSLFLSLSLFFVTVSISVSVLISVSVPVSLSISFKSSFVSLSRFNSFSCCVFLTFFRMLSLANTHTLLHFLSLSPRSLFLTRAVSRLLLLLSFSRVLSLANTHTPSCSFLLAPLLFHTLSLSPPLSRAHVLSLSYYLFLPVMVSLFRALSLAHVLSHSHALSVYVCITGCRGSWGRPWRGGRRWPATFGRSVCARVCVRALVCIYIHVYTHIYLYADVRLWCESHQRIIHTLDIWHTCSLASKIKM